MPRVILAETQKLEISGLNLVKIELRLLAWGQGYRLAIAHYDSVTHKAWLGKKRNTELRETSPVK